MEGDGVSGDDIHEQVECQAALVAETILKFLDVELDSSPANLLLEKELEQVKVALDDLIKLQKLKCGRAIAESLSEMEDFLGLIFRLMKVMITKLTASEISEVSLKILMQCHRCLISWTDKSRLFSERLLHCCSELPFQLLFELKLFHAMWVPSDDFIALSRNVLTILGNLAHEQKCHQALIQNKIPEAVIPFCFNSDIRIRWESKSVLAVLYKLTGPLYYPFLRLSLSEMKLLKVCFQKAATSNDGSVILKFGSSLIKYSAFELGLGVAGLTRHVVNRASFADPDTFAATCNLLATGSPDEKIVSVQLISNLVKDEPEMCSFILGNHPDLLEVLQSLSESYEVGDTLKQEASELLKILLDGVSGISSTPKGDTKDLKSTSVKAALLQRKNELDRLLAWATEALNNSKVLHNAADTEQSVGVVLSMVHLVSHLCEMLHFEDGYLSVHTALQGCPGFLSVLQDYTQRYFFKVIKKPSPFYPLHPISLALHCTLILSSCSSHFRYELGRNGILWQLVNNLRSMQMIPGWDKQHIRVAELMLLTIATCSLECNCQQLLSEDNIVKTLLPFCKSDYFVIRLAAKSSLSTISAFITKKKWKFLQIDQYERAALVNCLTEFSGSGSYKKEFNTSTACNYFFSALDLLRLLNALVENPLNVEVMKSSNICSVISQFLANGTEKEKNSIAELVWRLCRSHNMRSYIFNSLPQIQKQLPIEVFSSNFKEVLLFSSGLKLLEDIAPGFNSGSVRIYKKNDDVKEELLELEDLLFETMNEIWSGRVPAALEDGPYLLDSTKIVSIFSHMANFFTKTDTALHRELCLLIIEIPTFLHLMANVMVKLIEAKANKTDSKQDVSCIMIVFHCFQTWINCCEEVKDHLGHSQIISNLVMIYLELIQAFPLLDEEYTLIAEAVLSTLSQCTTRESCRNYLLNIDSQDLLVTFTKSMMFSISYNSKMVLSSLSRCLPPKYHSSFRLTAEELEDTLHSFDMIFKHGINEGELFFSALELLQSFKFFIQFEPNRELVAYSTVYKSIAHLLQSGDATEQREACELLWKLVTKPMSEDTVVIPTRKNQAEIVDPPNPHEYMSEPAIRSFLIQNYPEIFTILSTLSTQSMECQNILFPCALLVLMKESEEIIGKDIFKTLALAEGCYLSSKYAECFKLVSWLYQESNNEEVQRKALDLKGKALYYIFTSEKRSLENASRTTIVSCYNKAREAINLLGLTIDNGIDQVAERLLDQVHLDYIHKTRSPDLVRCLLCRNKRKLKASHVWPNSVLKHLLKCMCTSKSQVFSVPWKNYGSLQSSKQLTFPLLCDECEQLLSRSCENKFKVEFFSKLYDPEDFYTKLARSQSIEYGDYLYRFCLSIIFRALPLVDSAISQKGNADDIYDLFATCRELLLKKDILNSVNKPSIALLISPTYLPEGVTSVPMIDRILHSAGMILLSPWSLYNPSTFHGNASFLIASIGVLNLVVSLNPQYPLLLPPTTMINPKGGTFMVPENHKRFFGMPLGVWKELESAARSYSKQVFHMSEKLVKSQDWAKQELVDLQAMIMRSKPGEDEKLVRLHCLPDSFDTSRVSEIGGLFGLPAGHRILLHMHEREYDINHKTSIFLLVGADLHANSRFSRSSPYTLLVIQQPGYIVCIGYFVSREKAISTSCLEDKPILPIVETKFQTRATADALLPKLLHERGFSNMEELLFWLDRVQTLQLDMKCDVEICWYCSGKCDNCMEKTSFDRGPMLNYYKGNPIRFCKEECLKHYRFHKNASHTEIHFHTKTTPPDPAVVHTHFLTVFCGLLDINLDRTKVVAQFYFDDNLHETVYVLLQIRSVPKQKFLAFILSDDFFPLASLPNPTPLTDDDTFIAAGLQLVMKNFLTNTNFPNFSALVSSILEDGSLISLPERIEEPPLLPSIDCLQNTRVKISKECQAIICPDPYSIILHKAKETYTTYLLADTMAEADQYLALFHKCSTDCTIEAVYAVEDGPAGIAVKKLNGSQYPLSYYNELILESCKNIVCVELTSMLQERGVDHLGAIIAKYKPGSATSATNCHKTCWLCHPKSTQ